MEGSGNVVPAEAGHIPFLAEHMRREEQAEVWAASHATPGEALQNSLACSDSAWTALEPGTCTPMAMFGLALPSLLSGVGILWCLSTDAVADWCVPFAKHSRRYVRRMLLEVEVLTNYIDVRCAGGMAWLKWLGADFSPEMCMGPDRMPFRRFEIRRK